MCDFQAASLLSVVPWRCAELGELSLLTPLRARGTPFCLTRRRVSSAVDATFGPETSVSVRGKSGCMDLAPLYFQNKKSFAPLARVEAKWLHPPQLDVVAWIKSGFL